MRKIIILLVVVGFLVVAKNPFAKMGCFSRCLDRFDNVDFCEDFCKEFYFPNRLWWVK